MLDDLIGYEIQKKKLVDNTEAFIKGLPANNVLLCGDAGTGKSTSIKALLNEYYDQGLRMIEIYKHQFQDLSNIISQIKNRNYRFIIYMDDLSFEEFEIEYKFLKAVIEGGMETRPDNVLIYATSNRRHLIKETWNDRDDMETDNGMHRSDTMQEKLSLVARFGVTIYYGKPTPKEFFTIVTNSAETYPEITMSDEELCAEANKWELSHGGVSGRTAQQFINYIAGKCKEEQKLHFRPHFHGKMLQKSYKIIQNLWKQGWNQRKGGMYDAIAMEKQTFCIAGSRGSCLRHGGLFREGGGNVRRHRYGDDDTGGFGNYGDD